MDNTGGKIHIFPAGLEDLGLSGPGEQKEAHGQCGHAVDIGIGGIEKTAGFFGAEVAFPKRAGGKGLNIAGRAMLQKTPAAGAVEQIFQQNEEKR